MNARQKPKTDKRLWLALFKAADDYFIQKPWQHFDDTHLFGVQDPKTKAINYGCILGAAENTFGLIVYRGEKPLEQHQMLLDNTPGSEEFTHVLLKMNAIIAVLSTHEFITPEDIAVLEEIGLNPWERNAWPQFRSHVPGSPPITLDHEEIILLTHIFTQTLDIVLKNKDKPCRFAYNGIYGTYFVRMAQTVNNRLTWSDEWVTSPLAADCSAPSFRFKNTPRARRLRNLPCKTNSCFCVDLRWMTSCCICTDRGRPVFPQIFVIMNADTGKAVDFELLADHDNEELIETRFVTTLEEVGFIPEHIFTTSRKVQDIIAPLIAGTGCRVRRVGMLPLVDDFMQGLDQFMQRK